MSAPISIASFTTESGNSRIRCDGSKSWRFAPQSATAGCVSSGCAMAALSRKRFAELLKHDPRDAEARATRREGRRAGAPRRRARRAVRLRRLLPARSEPRQRRRKRIRIHRAEQPGEGVVAGKPVLRGHRPAQDRFVDDGKIRHLDASPPHRLESSAPVRLSRKSRRFALPVQRSSIPFEKLTEFLHVLPLRRTSSSDTLSSYTALGVDQQTLEIECLPP